MSDTVTRLTEIRAAISRAERDFGRKPGSVALVAVSKTKPAEQVAEVLEAGQRVFGENYVQEARAKWPALRERFPDAELHMIGPLQSNKARDAVALADAIHGLDRPSLAKALAAEIARQGRAPRLFIQVNTGEEPQKGGVMPGAAGDFLAECRGLGLAVSGLMCIPPEAEEPALHFALLAALAQRLGLAELSMGMSGDYEVAVKLGATCVRVGSAIFGART